MEARLIQNKDALTICTAIKDLIIIKHGVPQCILTDNGKEFCNSIISQLTLDYKINGKLNSPGHHKSVGLVERANQTLFKKIRKMSEYGDKDWKRVVEKAVYAYNISFHRGIDTSPFMIKYGKLPDMSVDAKHSNTTKSISIDALRNKRDRKFETYASKNIQKGKVRDLREFQNGDKVLIFKDYETKKIDSKWLQGFEIIGKTESGSYMVSDGRRTFRLNLESIKRDYASN